MQKNYDYVVIIPTVGIEGVITESIERFVYHSEPSTLFVLSFNPKNKKEAESVAEYCKAIFETRKQIDCDMQIVWSDKPIGFGAAINKAYSYVKENGIQFDKIIISNDDIVPVEDWQYNLKTAIETELFSTHGSLNSKDNELIGIEKLGGKVGAVGPVSNGVYNEQLIQKRDATGALRPNVHPDIFAKDIGQSKQYMGKYIPTTFLSGFCTMFTRECWEDLCKDGDFLYGGPFDTETYPVGGFEDNDLNLRMIKNGYRSLIALDTYIEHSPHSTLNKVFPDKFAGVGNVVYHLLKYEKETQKEQKVIGAYRVAIKCINDLAQMKSSIQRAATLIDGAAILLTNNPAESLSSYDGALFERLEEADKNFLVQCEENPDDCHEFMEEWISKTIKNDKFSFSVELWKGEFNERDERNHTHVMAEGLDADWILSIDADEVLEDRLTRSSIQKIVTNPSPDKHLYNVSFINHWESTQLVRLDWPFADSYRSSMNGPRLFKVFKNCPMRIFSGSEIGLHCGNSPEYGGHSIGVSNIRFRHLSHVRSIDRSAKFSFYQNIDKQKNPTLVGFNNYSHISKRDDMQVSLYKPDDGIALHMLAYEKEPVVGIWRQLHNLYPLVDRIAIVWTGEFEEKDKAWMSTPYENWPTEEEWENVYPTGPSWGLAHLIRLYKVELLIKRFKPENGLAECRNVAINHFRNTNDGRLGWCVFVDPDEHGLGMKELVAMRRMAEINDTVGWMFPFKNPLRGNSPAASSESIRMVKLDKNLNLNMSGRVHESFNDSLHDLMNKYGVEPKIKIAPFELINTGLMKNPDQMGEKLSLYQQMLLKELDENPLHSGSWLSLGLQYINDNQVDKAKICFERACMCAENAFLPYKEMGLLLLKESMTFLMRCFDRLKKGHPYYQPCGQMLKTLSQMCPDAPKVDTGEFRPSANLELPHFPYDKIGITPRGEFFIMENEDGNKDTKQD